MPKLSQFDEKISLLKNNMSLVWNVIGLYEDKISFSKCYSKSIVVDQRKGYPPKKY